MLDFMLTSLGVAIWLLVMAWVLGIAVQTVLPIINALRKD